MASSLAEHGSPLDDYFRGESRTPSLWSLTSIDFAFRRQKGRADGADEDVSHMAERVQSKPDHGLENETGCDEVSHCISVVS